ncbi:Zinc finger, CCHC-type superfamily [Sesbania bispinosa]|nr:Zinc finger, CCHC-type superfamily [Sesbania bispinosa]
MAIAISRAKHPQPQSQPCPDLHHELNNKKEKGNEANAEHPQVCPKPPLDVTIPTNLIEKKKEHRVPEPTPSNDTPQKKKKCEKKKKNVLQPQGSQPKEPSNAEHPQPQSCSKPGPGVPTIPIDKSKIKQRNRGGRKGMCSDEPVENPRNLSLMQRTLNLAQNKPDSPIPLCSKPSSLIDQTIPVDPAPSICPEPVEPVGQTIPVDTAKLVDTEQEMKKQDGKKGNIVLDGAGPNEHNMESSETPIQTSICHTAAPLVGPTVPVDPHPTIPTDQGILVVVEHKASKKKRKRKRKSDFKSDGEKPNESNIELIEAPADTSTCHTAAPPVDPHPAIPTAGVIPTDPEHKTSKKKRRKNKKSDLKSEGEKPNEHNSKPPETPVQRSTYPKAAPSIEPATLKVAKQQMTKKKRKSALKIQGAKSNQDDTDLAAETQIQRSRPVPVPKAYYGSSMICQSCLQHGHKFERCPRLRCLSNDEEICFFCGEIGHSLGKCSVSKAGS